MKSKAPEYRAAYWKKWAAENIPTANRPCPTCGQEFRPIGVQKVCRACSRQVCAACGKDFWKDRKRKFCSKACHIEAQKGVEPQRLAANRGKKPRTYHLRHRDKHGSAADREWRSFVFARDNYTCQSCGVKGGRLQADHIKPYKEFPELRHVLENGRTLCEPCHRKTETYGWSKYWHQRHAARRMAQEVLPL